MNKQRMIRMLENAREAVAATDLATTLVSPNAPEGRQMTLTEGTQNLIGQLILASAIESSGSLVSDSIDKLDKLAQELGEVARVLSR